MFFTVVNSITIVDWEIDSVRQLCEVRMERMYAEQLIQARDTTYLNIYCAICNRENSSYISYWPHVQKCALANNSSVDINNLTHFSNISDIKALLERGKIYMNYKNVLQK